MVDTDFVFKALRWKLYFDPLNNGFGWVHKGIMGSVTRPLTASSRTSLATTALEFILTMVPVESRGGGFWKGAQLHSKSLTQFFIGAFKHIEPLFRSGGELVMGVQKPRQVPVFISDSSDLMSRALILVICLLELRRDSWGHPGNKSAVQATLSRGRMRRSRNRFRGRITLLLLLLGILFCFSRPLLESERSCGGSFPPAGIVKPRLMSHFTKSFQPPKCWLETESKELWQVAKFGQEQVDQVPSQGPLPSSSGKEAGEHRAEFKGPWAKMAKGMCVRMYVCMYPDLHERL